MKQLQTQEILKSYEFSAFETNRDHQRSKLYQAFPQNNTKKSIRNHKLCSQCPIPQKPRSQTTCIFLTLTIRIRKNPKKTFEESKHELVKLRKKMLKNEDLSQDRSHESYAENPNRTKQTNIDLHTHPEDSPAAKSFQVAETFSHEHINVQKHIHKYEYFKDLLKMVIL